MSEDTNLSRDLKPSQELLEILAEARESNETTVELVKKAYDLAIRDGFHPLQARDFLMAELSFLGESTIRKALPSEAKDSRKVRTTALSESQNTEPKESNVVNITTKAEIKDAEIVKPDPDWNDEQSEKEEPVIESEDPREIQIQMLKETVQELEEALRKTQQFKPATQLTEEQAREMTMEAVKQAGLAVPEFKLNDDAVFQYLRERARATGDIIHIDRVGSGVLAQSLYQYKGTFGVAELFLRIIK